MWFDVKYVPLVIADHNERRKTSIPWAGKVVSHRSLQTEEKWGIKAWQRSSVGRTRRWCNKRVKMYFTIYLTFIFAICIWSNLVVPFCQYSSLMSGVDDNGNRFVVSVMWSTMSHFTRWTSFIISRVFRLSVLSWSLVIHNLIVVCICSYQYQTHPYELGVRWWWEVL